MFLLLFLVIQLSFIYFLVDLFRTGYTGWKRWKAQRAADKVLIDEWNQLVMFLE